VPFPCTSVVMDCQEEKCEHHLVDFVFVVFHEIMLPFSSQSFNRGSKMKTPNKARGRVKTPGRGKTSLPFDL
jgi:hypothetical protein